MTSACYCSGHECSYPFLSFFHKIMYANIVDHDLTPRSVRFASFRSGDARHKQVNGQIDN